MKLFTKQHYSQIVAYEKQETFRENQCTSIHFIGSENFVVPGNSLQKQTRYLWEKIY